MTTPSVGGTFWTAALTQTAVKTSAYTANPNELVRVDTTSGSVTVTLPAQPAAGVIVAVKMVTLGGSNTVTVTSVAGDVFNKAGGGTTATLSLLGQGVVLEYAGGIWMVLADDLPLSQLDARYDQQSVLTTLGDMLYENSTPAPARLAGSTSATKAFLTQTGNGTVSAAPAWGTIAAGDVPQLADYAPTGLTGATAASRYVGATTSGAPASGTFAVGDYVVDRTGVIWICTTLGTPGTWTSAAALALPLSGGTMAGILHAGAGTDSSGSAPILTAVAGTNGGGGVQLADLTRDYTVYLQVGTAGTAWIVSMGHTNSANDVTLHASGVATAGQTLTFRLPAGWYFLWSATTATLAQSVAVGC